MPNSSRHVPGDRMAIVGGGECAARAAFALRDQGWDGAITIVTRERRLPYERPPLSKAALTAAGYEPAHPYTWAQFQQAEIDVMTGVEGRFIDTATREVALSDGTTLGYHRLLLALGARVRRLRVEREARPLYLRTYDDALAISRALKPGRRIGVIGAGLIGLELAAAARSRGCHVVVLEAADGILTRAVPPAVAEHIRDEHLANGVSFHLGASVADVEPRNGSGVDVLLTTGARMRFDVLVVGIGVSPETSLAMRSKLEVDNGIKADAFLRTSAESVFAAGDCVSFPHSLFGDSRVRLESWRNAVDQAETVAANMLGQLRPHRAVPWFWSEQYALTLQVAGLQSMVTSSVVRTRDDGVQLHFGMDVSGRLVAASAVGQGNSVARDIRLAERMIERGAEPLRKDLVDASVPLKRVLASTEKTTAQPSRR